MRGGWRHLALFWAGVLVVLGGGGVALEVTQPRAAPHPAPAPAATLRPAPLRVTSAPQLSEPTSPPALPASAPGSIRPPDPALMEPAPDFPGRFLPRRAADGRSPFAFYARAPGSPGERPVIAMLVAGLGQSEADSLAASAALPGAVSLGFSPYSLNPDPLLADARAHGHEYLLTLPMESQGFPLNDSGPHALLTGADPAVNARNLQWVLSRLQGEVGLTGASDGLRGERFASADALLGPLLEQLAGRGLLYVDPRPTAAAKPGSLAITMVVDDPPDRASVDAKLTLLEQRARDGTPVVGLASLPRPMTVERIAAWARGLEGRGVALVPVSALVPPVPAP